MRLSVKVVACAAVMLLGTAQPAHAFWRWLEHMSGPGWYDGFSIEFKRWGRYPRPNVERIDEATKKMIAAEKSVATLEALLRWELLQRPRRDNVIAALASRLMELGAEPERLNLLMLGIGVSIPLPSERRVGNLREPRKQTAGWSAGLMWSTINRLRYDPAVSPEDTQVWVLTAGPFYDYRLSGLLNRVEVGGSAEAYLFFGNTTRTMVRLALEPRATVTLGTIRDETSGNPAINFKLRVGALWVMPGFDPEDFGALPGERLGPEVLTSIRLVVDMECWPWKRGSC